MSKELATRALFADALAGRIDRRTLLRRAAALGLSAPVAAALARKLRARRWRPKRVSRNHVLQLDASPTTRMIEDDQQRVQQDVPGRCRDRADRELRLRSLHRRGGREDQHLGLV